MTCPSLSELDRIAREGSWDEVRDAALASGMAHPELRRKFREMWEQRGKAIEAAAKKLK